MGVSDKERPDYDDRGFMVVPGVASIADVYDRACLEAIRTGESVRFSFNGEIFQTSPEQAQKQLSEERFQREIESLQGEITSSEKRVRESYEKLRATRDNLRLVHGEDNK